MTTALATMIAAQPDVISALAEPVTAADRLAGARRVWLIGTGTSLHAAELGASALETAGIDARAIAANRFTAARPGDAAIVITHTGQTAHARRARRLVLDAGLPLVSITGPDVDWPDAVRTPVAEKSETYTVSYTAALTVLAGIAHHLGAPGLDPPKIQDTADAVRRVLADPGVDAVGIPARAMAIVGPGDWSVTAREGALKIREGARLLCEGFDPDRLLHGAAVPYGPADTLLALAPSDDLTAALAHAARVTGLGVHLMPATGDGLLAQIPTTVRLQLLALRFARQRAQNADIAITGAWADHTLWETL
ncbi:SIS domain-containing protein [Actinoplanes sp. NPDC048988]|uniref:SIS domain-containing protein n=1 Tax=Actinoplanes sp. NPDC048988 TaxID=3363901 RepID=UPI0037236600